ncbi:ATP-binding protein [Kwoniella heveanensis BCC8398]|uniref:Ribokinase n=1 Tax=Kwoniella heveanensis BCC8398 TaxID=1296120 RepID=A0A1B9GTA0_9TREE|nr:ATP-binding protein [Kwoniella heveanensis BCC8398]
MSSTSSAEPKCLVRGSINIDEFFHLPHIVRPGETISSTSLTKRAGGKGANQAFAVARAGRQVVLDGCVGSDGVWVKEMLEKGGVDVGRVQVLEDELTGRAIIQSAADGENSIVLHAGANYHLPSSSSTHSLPPNLDGITHLLLQNEIPLSSTLSYLTSAGSSGSVTSVFNPSPMLTPDQLRHFPWKDLSWLIVNEGELGDLLLAFSSPSASSSQCSSAEDGNVPNSDEKDVVGALDENSSTLIEDAKKGILALHRNSFFSPYVGVICTLGSKGILYFDPILESESISASASASPNGTEQVGYLPAGKLVNPLKDTTGAGDCFAGYFIAGLMERQEAGTGDLESILKTCLTACAICVENQGAMESVPSRSSVNERLA